ncbi:unnamed protein product [Caenorhabditis bovis]|uniref:Uncharacterized protein n=1 Tax=Caenorhabditis bovis TaxID=2654633 RepID=A0A8S1F2P4_9PELO|nr:unnamed protein product [Caenorhabditis bovis]
MGGVSQHKATPRWHVMKSRRGQFQVLPNNTADMFAKVTVLEILCVTAQAGFFDSISGTASDVGNFFSTQFQNAKDLLANDQSELDKNIQRVMDLLTNIKSKISGLTPLANDAQKKTLNSVDEFLNKVTSFQKEVKQEGAAKFEENKSKWQSMVDDMFEKGGLDDVVKMLRLNSGSPVFSCAALVAPIFYALFVR